MCDFIARVFLRCCVCCLPWFVSLPNQGTEYHAVATNSMENKKLTGSGSIEATHKCSACLCETIQGSTIANQPFVLAASLCTAPGNGRHCWERKFPGPLAAPPVCNYTLYNLLAEDVLSETANNSLEPTVIKAGDNVCLADEREIQIRIPTWLKGAHPRCAVPTLDASLVDFNLPLPANIFYRNMETHMKSSSMGEAFSSVDASNILLVGASGCGKTSAGFALAAQRYVIFLECPAGGEQSRAGCRGYRMSQVHWWGQLQTEDEVMDLFCCELAARLVVLVNLLRQHREALTPLGWLHYVQSCEGEARIGRLFDRLVHSVRRVIFVVVQQLLSLVQEHQVGVDGLQEATAPVLFVDEVQWLASMSDVTCTTGATRDTMSVTKAMMRAAGLLAWGFVWSGTRISVPAESGHSSAGIAKQRKGCRELRVVGDFQYMRPEDVNIYLDAVLELSVSDGMRQQLCHLLQGRARMVTGFIALLLTPTWDAQAGCVTLRGAGLERLNNEVLREALEVFMKTFVVKLFLDEIDCLRNLPGECALRRDDLGHLWRLSMVQTNESPPASQRKVTARFNGLPFTNHVYETTDPYRFPATVTYAFDYTFGEPGLQEALRRVVASNRELAETWCAPLAHAT